MNELPPCPLCGKQPNVTPSRVFPEWACEVWCDESPRGIRHKVEVRCYADTPEKAERKARRAWTRMVGRGK